LSIVTRNQPPFGANGRAIVYAGEAVTVGFRLTDAEGAVQDYTDRAFGLRVYDDGGTTRINLPGVLTSHADGDYIAFTIEDSDTSSLTAALRGWEFVEFVDAGRVVIMAGSFQLAIGSGAAQASGSPGSGGSGVTLYELATDTNIVTVQYLGAPGAAGSQVVSFILWASGRPGAAEVLVRAEIDTAVTLAEARCRASALTASTGTAVFSVEVGGTPIGTVTFTASASGVVDITTSAVAAGAVLTITAPSPQDATLAGVSITLSGDR
jgi:hypothetical protein